MRVRFVLGEVGAGLRRNLTMTIAVVITVAVSLALFGTGLLVRAQVDKMKDYWYDKVEVSIFLCGPNSDTASCAGGAVTQAQRDEILADLNSLKPLVQDVYYESSQEAFDRFKQQFAGSPLVGNAKPEDLPESYRVKLSDPQKYDVVASAFAGRPGIEEVNDQREFLDKFFKLLNGLQLISLCIAIAMLVVTVLLVVNTMRVAAFSRRRETGIMRLVGASNFYIQLPFLLEAALAAALGAACAVGGLIAVKVLLVDRVLVPSFPFTAFIGWDTVVTAGLQLFIVGTLLAAVAAFLTLRKYLRV
ncbi:MAG: ABC transporter permease [Actinomycetota bacterium]|nr:MAG: ABC transporter permease [Actinomycetota bacterium]